MTTLYYYKIFCVTDNQFEYVWRETPPTVCPVNNTHTVNTSSISIDNIVSETTVKIKEENVPTGENFMCESYLINCATGIDEVTITDFTYPVPITVLGVEILCDQENKGDEISLCVAPDTVIGVITASAATGATGANVSPTVVEYIMPGYHMCLTNGISLFDCGRVISIDLETNHVLFENSLTSSFSALSPTYVTMTVYTINNYIVGGAGIREIGKGKIGGSYVPANTLVRSIYKNKTGGEKTMSGQIEYLY